MPDFSTPLSPEVLLDIVALGKDAIGIYTGEDIVIQFANDAMIAFWGKDRTVIGNTLGKAVPELQGQPFIGLLQEVWRTGKTYAATDVEAVLTVNGQTRLFYFDFKYRALLDEKNNTYAILHTATEVTARMEALTLIREKEQREQELIAELTVANRKLSALNEQLSINNEQLISSDHTSQALNKKLSSTIKNLVESEERFRLMAEGTDVMIALGDETGEATYFNAAWIKATGRSAEDLLKFGWVDLIHPEDKDRVLHVFDTAIKEFESWEWEFRLTDPEDGSRWFLARGTPRFAPDGSFLGYVSSTIDITDRKAEEQRRIDFIGIVSHELRSPLTSANGYFQVLELKAKKIGDESMVDIAGKGKRQVSRMSNIISGFLDVARLGQAKLQLNKTRFDMADLIKSAEAESLATVTTHNIIYHPVEYTPVEADWDKIEQVVINFVNNAVKYSPENTTIHVACITRDGMAHISVADEGMGIPGKALPHIFERFYRVDGEHTKTVNGFGIGLYVSKEIIDAHGGHIGVESIEKKGSTFWFDLPKLLE